MYIMNGGSKPTGEVYLTPPNSNGTKMVMHYYDGTEIVLAEFKTKVSSVQSGSIERRIRDCESHIASIEKYLSKTLAPAIRYHNSTIDEDGNYSSKLIPNEWTTEDPVYDEEPIEPKDDEDDNRYNTPYHIENYDHWR